MKLTTLRIGLDVELFKKYKIYCVQNEISLPKQTAALIKTFLAMREEDKKRLEDK